MDKIKKGFTIIELIIAIAIIGILAGVISIKVIKQLNRAKVAKLEAELESSRTLLQVQYSTEFKFPTLNTQDKNIIQKYKIVTTPGFTSTDGIHYKETNKIVTTRDDTGGWYYNISNGEFYANLPNGAYTHDEKYEVWGGESSLVVSSDTPNNQGTPTPKHLTHNPVSSPKTPLTTTPKVTPSVKPHPSSSSFKNLGHVNPSLDFNKNVKFQELEKNPILGTARGVRSLASGGITKDNDGIKLHPEIIKTSDGKTILHIKPEIVQKIEHSDGFSSGFLAFLDNHNLNHVIPDIPNQALISDKQLISLDDIYLDLTDLPEKPKTFTMMFEYFNSDKNDQQAYAYKTVTLDYGTK